MLALACAGSACQSRRPYSAAEEDTTPTAVRIDRAALLVRQAQRLEVAGNIDGAMAKYREAIAEYREVPVAWNNLGDLLARNGDNMQAADAFKTAAELSPTDPRPLYNLGALWERLGYYDEALKWYDQALTRQPDFQDGLRRFLLVQSIQNKTDDSTQERLKTALLLEKDPWWINHLKKFHLRTTEDRADAAPDSMAK